MQIAVQSRRFNRLEGYYDDAIGKDLASHVVAGPSFFFLTLILLDGRKWPILGSIKMAQLFCVPTRANPTAAAAATASAA